jgi:Prokaryotic dksA/traR C4-type zinc finger
MSWTRPRRTRRANRCSPPGSVSWRVSNVSAALARLEAGGYGQCTDCGAAIGVARLCALPQATRCVACQERHELMVAARLLETRHQPIDRGATALLAEAIAATTEQSVRAEDAPQVNTRGAPPVALTAPPVYSTLRPGSR